MTKLRMHIYQTELFPKDNARSFELVGFIIEKAIELSICEFPPCRGGIWFDTYRVAISPGLCPQGTLAPNYYHVSCFKRLMDFTRPENVLRIMPPTAGEMIASRGLSANDDTQKLALLNLGAIRLIETWKHLMLHKIEEHHTTQIPPVVLSVEFDNEEALMKHQPAESAFKYESSFNGPMIEAYLDLCSDLDELVEMQNLSHMLQTWQDDIVGPFYSTCTTLIIQTLLTFPC